MQGYAPWALKRVAPLGLAPPPGNCQGTRLSGHNTPPRTTRDKRAALWQEPRWGKEPCFGKGPCCGKSRSAGHPRRASGLQPRACPNGRASPYRGAIPPQSPGCVALQGRPNPGLISPPYKEALQGRPLKRPWCVSWRLLWRRRPVALLGGRACRHIDRYASAAPTAPKS